MYIGQQINRALGRGITSYEPARVQPKRGSPTAIQPFKNPLAIQLAAWMISTQFKI